MIDPAYLKTDGICSIKKEDKCQSETDETTISLLTSSLFFEIVSSLSALRSTLSDAFKLLDNSG
jgi:hypothetical protein